MLKFVCFLCIVCWATMAQALHFAGGSGDGYASSLTYARSWGFIGGPGRGEMVVLAGSQTLLTLTSAASQIFKLNAAPTWANDITIRQDVAVGTGIVVDSDIYITIPSSLAMAFDPVSTIEVSTGEYVSTSVRYTNDNKRLVLRVTKTFNDGDAVTLKNLKFRDFTLASVGNLLLNITVDAGPYEPDFFDKLILIDERVYGFIGGFGRGEALIDLNQHPRNPVDFGTLF